MTVYFYQAECGDAARISYTGSDNKVHNIFIDAGYERTFRHVLTGQIQSIRNAGETIDLWVASHIHDDHIGGIIAYLKSIADGEFPDIVDRWYYNPPRLLIIDYGIPADSISQAKSIVQGDQLAQYLITKNKLPQAGIVNTLPQLDLFGLKITVLSPDDNSLNKLRKKYPAGSDNPFEQNEISSVSEAKAARKYDYDIPVNSFYRSVWKEDDSVENGSSIALLTEYDGTRILWLADAQPTTVLNSLKKLGYSNENPLICDLVKVTHHGSNGNNSSQLYQVIKCTNYILSVNGENIHYLPSKECLFRILNNPRRNDSVYNFYFTYDNNILRNIFKVDGENIFHDFNFKMHYHPGTNQYLEFNF